MTSKVWDNNTEDHTIRNIKFNPASLLLRMSCYIQGCAIKYIIRHRDKGKKQDLLKAIHFIEMIMERDYSETDI